MGLVQQKILKARAISGFGNTAFLFGSSSSVIDGIVSEPTLKCMGSLVNFSSILSQAFRASTVFVGIAVLFSILCVVAMLLFCVMKDRSVFEICSIFQALQGVSMVIGILCSPAGWDHEQVRGICGKESKDYFLAFVALDGPSLWPLYASLTPLFSAFWP